MNEDTWNARISSAAQALGIPSEELTTTLAEKIGITEAADGVTMLDDEEVFKFGDFRDAVPGPIAKLRLAFKCLRGGRKADDRASAGDRTAQLQALGHKAKLADASNAELLSLYDPRKGLNDPVTRTLKERHGDRRIIAFKDDGTVAADECAAYLSDLEHGSIDQSDTLLVDGKLTRLWPVGVVPDTTVDEDPLFPGRALHNGKSQVNYRDWSPIKLEQRQFCRLVVEMGFLDATNREAVMRLLERAAEGKLAEAYPEVDLEFRERGSRDELPKLKIALSQVQKPSNPFGIKRTY